MNQTTQERKFDPRINHAPTDFDIKTDLPEGFAEFFADLHKQFTPRQQELAQKRAEILSASHKGDLPDYRETNEEISGDWRIVLPKWCADQRNQMTGPADDGELVVKMLNSGAPGVMIDLEDSMANRLGKSRNGNRKCGCGSARRAFLLRQKARARSFDQRFRQR